MNRIMQRETWMEARGTEAGGAADLASRWGVRIEMVETDSAFAVRFELVRSGNARPGLPGGFPRLASGCESDIARRDERGEVRETFRSVSRCFALSDSIDAGRICAEAEHGSLRVVFPKTCAADLDLRLLEVQ